MFLHKEIYPILNTVIQNEKFDKSAEELESTALIHMRGSSEASMLNLYICI